MVLSEYNFFIYFFNSRREYGLCCRHGVKKPPINHIGMSKDWLAQCQDNVRVEYQVTVLTAWFLSGTTP